MTKIHIIIISLFMAMICITSCTQHTNTPARVRIIENTTVAPIENNIHQLIQKHGSDQILVVFDIDNTLLTTVTDLGGDIWYQWQRGKLKTKPSEEQIVDCLFEDAIGLLYELSPMELTDERLPVLIDHWQAKDVPMFALTSRNPRARAATERELRRHKIDLSKTAIRPKNDSLPVLRYNLEREMSYMNGVMMTSGMNKGEMLQHLLTKFDLHYKHIIFVDDSEKNVKNLEEAFRNGNTELTIYHFTKIEEDRRAINGGLVVTPKQADEMHQDWLELNKTLNNIFPARILEDGHCLGGE